MIPAYNEEALLPGTLDALDRAMREVSWAGEVVVCDNNSTDRTPEIARESGARVVFEPINQISRARNTGARAARGRWLIWIDADTRASGRLIQQALDGLAAGKIAGGGATFAMDGDPGRVVRRMLACWTWVSLRWSLAAGAFVFALADAFEGVGGFSEKVYASEEVWFSRAVTRWGRERGLDFTILQGHPVVTSPRKIEWYSPILLGAMALLFAGLPFLTRSRALCFLWYRRPG